MTKLALNAIPGIPGIHFTSTSRTDACNVAMRPPNESQAVFFTGDGLVRFTPIPVSAIAVMRSREYGVG